MQAMRPETVQCSIPADTVICDDQLITMDHGEEILLDAGIIQNQIDLEEVGLEEQFEEHSEVAQETEIDPDVAHDESQQTSTTELHSTRSQANVVLNELGKNLLTASRAGKADEVKKLIAKGAPFTCDWLGTSALHLASKNNHRDVVEVLLRAGISRDSRTKVDKTALHLAATEGHSAIVKLLIRNGTDVNVIDMLKMTPLHWAVDREHMDVIRILVENGANANIVSKFEKTPYTIAADNGRPDIIKFIQSIKPLDMNMSQEAELALQEATLAATDSISIEMAQVPAVSQQEEVETSEANKFFEDEPILEGEEIPLQEDNVDMQPEDDGTVVPTTQTIEYLESHGITMLPMDESTLAESAIESGGKVVLTEAGKLALAKMNMRKVRSPIVPTLRIPRKRLGLKNKHLIKSSNILKHLEEVEETFLAPSITSIAPDGEVTMVQSPTKKEMFEMKVELAEARQIAANAERVANEAQREKKEARLEVKKLKERLGKMQRENEQCLNIIKTLKQK